MPHDYLDNVRRLLLTVAEEWWIVGLLADAADAAGRATFNPDDPEAVRLLTKARQMSEAGAHRLDGSDPADASMAELLDPPDRLTARDGRLPDRLREGRPAPSIAVY